MTLIKVHNLGGTWLYTATMLVWCRYAWNKVGLALVHPLYQVTVGTVMVRYVCLQKDAAPLLEP